MDYCNNYPSYRHIPSDSGSYLHPYHHHPHPLYSSAMRYQGHSGAFRSYGYPSYYDPYPYHHQNYHYQSPVASSYANLREGFGGSYSSANMYPSSGGHGGGVGGYNSNPSYYNHQPPYVYDSYRASSGFQYQPPYRDFYNSENSLYSSMSSTKLEPKDAPTYLPPASPFAPVHHGSSSTSGSGNGTPKSAYSEPSDDAVSHHSGSSHSAYCEYPASPATPFREQLTNNAASPSVSSNGTPTSTSSSTTTSSSSGTLSSSSSSNANTGANNNNQATSASTTNSQTSTTSHNSTGEYLLVCFLAIITRPHVAGIFLFG